MSVKVAVICLCYNHEKYVQEAMESVLFQTYITELIIVDDASTDNSIEKIKQCVSLHSDKEIKPLFLKENIGNCKAFNRALRMTEADYIIDLAADDVLLPKRVAEGVTNMEANPQVAVNFTNALYIDEAGKKLNSHFRVDQDGKTVEQVPEGNLFHHILERYFVCSPSMMYRASYLNEIGGYDEGLAYEDFDIMLRLSRNHPFSYTDEILVKKRVLPTSMSKKQYKKGNQQLISTLRIVEKAYGMIRNKEEKRALLKRIIYEAKQAFINKRFLLFLAFTNLCFKTILQK